MGEKTADRRTRKTRKAIFDAFAELLSEKELEKITVKELIDKADVSRVTFYNHYLDIYDLHDKFEESTMLEIASLVLELDTLSYKYFFTRLIGYVSENRSAFRMIFSPHSTNKMRFRLEDILEGLLLQLYLEVNEDAVQTEEIGYMIYYRAQGMISVIQKWIREEFRTTEENIIRLMTVLDGRTEEYFTSWMNKRK
ncbi:MAG: TetR/AcrR family transcriptional regulator C-terminal domain-containing protein [Ruminiclostridium sp.]|nr:TetR/AcrR family transcriptional regulator C-terminal domain-containing protein [Ruminiclostridium sp.]